VIMSKLKKSLTHIIVCNMVLYKKTVEYCGSGTLAYFYMNSVFFFFLIVVQGGNVGNAVCSKRNFIIIFSTVAVVNVLL